ncbi:MAG: serine/threonine-protein kinase PknK, partial [Myxococcales bacterium]|nr:serine/threonine-protein kinase PknK [Myxococcales bacterium]
MSLVPQTFEETIPAAGRFRLHRRLGAGGMGVVYEAYDRERDEVVALKTLRRVSADGLFLFKQEFRALADVTHPNLVTLYELLAVDDQWFFTMELLRGRDILSYLRDAPHAPLADALAPPSAVTRTADVELALPELTSATSAVARSAPIATTVPGVDGDTIRPVLRQLVSAIAALHATGYLHCDIKPSNVMVTDDGRVVVLDYGVVTAMAPDGERAASWRGTPAYMSPEQATAGVATEASDWYAVGMILYEALAGRRPFVAADARALAAIKRSTDPPDPRSHAPDADPELAALCLRLLARDPDLRPSVEELTQALGEVVVATPSAWPARDDVALIGRGRELTRMRAAYDQARAGQGTALRIKGTSGCGKTTLVERFLDHIAREDDALVLAGRCYERESVPHQAVDGLVDALCAHLLSLPRDVADAVMPVDVLAMARAFPVLARVEAVAQARRRSAALDPDPVELRRRAHGALRELIARIAERQPLVLFIDDLQWGDVDSAPLLADLLRPPVPPLLLLVAYRSEDVASSALLRTLLGRDGALAR